MSTTNSETSSKHTGFALLTGLISLLYAALLLDGYFNLFISKWGGVASGLVALLLTAIALILARQIGHNGGVRLNKVLFTVLLLISAVGVFNSLMLMAQGEQIFRDETERAATEFQNLSQTANKHLLNEQADGFISEINSLKQNLAQEMRNPVNCGEGSAAAAIMAELKAKLPTFTKLSGGFKDCAKVEKIIPMYDAQIDKALWSAPILVSSHYQDIYAAKQKVLAAEKQSNQSVGEIMADIQAGENLLTVVRPKLEIMSLNYRQTAQELIPFLPKEAQASVHPQLDLTAVRSLGDPVKFVNLIVSRLSDPLTWVFLIVALLLDSFLVWLFFQTSSAGKNIPSTRASPSDPSLVNNPWK